MLQGGAVLLCRAMLVIEEAPKASDRGKNRTVVLQQGRMSYFGATGCALPTLASRVACVVHVLSFA